jgi:hypothetical protein
MQNIWIGSYYVVDHIKSDSIHLDEDIWEPL